MTFAPARQTFYEGWANHQRLLLDLVRA